MGRGFNFHFNFRKYDYIQLTNLLTNIINHEENIILNGTLSGSNMRQRTEL